MIKKVAYSIIIGDNNNISPFPILEGFDYFIFSDLIYNNTNSIIIVISKLIKKENLSSQKKYLSIFPIYFFKGYELSIYFDASNIINGDSNE
jgi:hypothetical protein